MPGLTQAWWLVALGVIPLIRWLHRRQAPLSLHDVSAVFLWRATVEEDSAGHELRPPDPAWKRRALIVALLVLALAAPYINRENDSVTVWIDNSPSMQALEDGEPRMVAAERALALLLDQRSDTRISRQDLVTPYPELLDSSSANWLVSDGASEELRHWAKNAQFDRVIQAGQATNNSAVTQLSVRHDLVDQETLQVLVSVSNAGESVDERTVQLLQGDQLVDTEELLIGPGQTVHWQTRLSADTGSVTAMLNAGDALTGDDYLTIPGAAVEPLQVHVDENCDANLRLAFFLHPALTAARSGTTNDLLVTCSGELAHVTDLQVEDPQGPRIHFVQGTSSPVTSLPVWLPYEGLPGSLQLSVDNLRATVWPRDSQERDSKTLLRANGVPLVRASPLPDGKTSRVETVIDFRDQNFAKQAVYAGLVATLVDAATGRSLLDPVIRQSREVADVAIRPVKIEVSQLGRKEFMRSTAMPLYGPLLLISVLLIVFDMLLLLRTRQRANHA